VWWESISLEWDDLVAYFSISMKFLKCSFISTFNSWPFNFIYLETTFSVILFTFSKELTGCTKEEAAVHTSLSTTSGFITHRFLFELFICLMEFSLFFIILWVFVIFKVFMCLTLHLFSSFLAWIFDYRFKGSFYKSSSILSKKSMWYWVSSEIDEHE
jgi:hypothetical protein